MLLKRKRRGRGRRIPVINDALMTP